MRRLFAVLVALVGVLTIGSAMLPPLRGRVHLVQLYLPLGDIQLAAVLSVQAGLLLLFIARQLARGKRRAWALSVILLGASAGLHLAKGLDVEEASVSIVVALTLIAYRGRFRAASDAPSFSRLVRSLPLLIAAPFVYGVTALFLRDGNIVGGFKLSAAISEVAWRLLWLSGPVDYTGRFFRGWFPMSISVLGAVVAVRILFLAFRPVVGHAPHRSPVDESDLRRLTTRDCGTLAYFLLRDDKQVFFNAERTAALGYGQVGGVVLVSGDPVGDPSAWPGLISSFSDHAHARGWSLAGLGLTERAASAFEAIGCRLVYLGDEAIVDPQSFSLDGRAIRKVRQACSSLERQGYTVEWHKSGELHPDLQRALQHVSSSWREGTDERGFSMSLGRLFDPRDAECLVAVARDDGSRVRAFLHFVPAGPNGYSLDVMRRDRDTPTGINEWLIARTLEHLAGLGAREVSLNFAFMRGVIRPEDKLGPLRRLQKWIVLKLGPWFQIESLYRFNNKFGPAWRNRYAAVEDRLSIPAVLMAALRAEKLLDVSALRSQRNRRKAGLETASR